MKPLQALALCGLATVAFTSCSGGGAAAGGGGSDGMDLIEITNGFGLLVPYQVFRADAQGNPTPVLIQIRKHEDLIDNVNPLNPILPLTTWPVTATLPDGTEGNHFISARFTQPILVNSVLDPSASGQGNSGLLGPISMVATDPVSGSAISVKGRAFVGGRTYATNPETGLFELMRWVYADAGMLVVQGYDSDGDEVPDWFPGLGFPGTQASGAPFPGALDLVRDDAFVFIPDEDGTLLTHEEFPSGRQVRLKVSTAVKAVDGRELARSALGSATVGPDTIVPEVGVTPPPNSVPQVTPGAGQTDVDPQTSVRITFTEPLQPHTLGTFPTGSPSSISAAVSMTFGPPSQIVQVPFSILPPSVFDLSVWDLTPTFAFPGAGPAFQQCGTFNEVTVAINSAQYQDLSANTNQLAAQTNFFTGKGPGLVNAPVAPEAIYVGRVGAESGLSVIDLNGFGGSTGDPSFDFTYSTFPEGWSNFPNNPNVRLQGALIRPGLQPGSCTVDGGSAGAFTLTLDSNLESMLLGTPLITSVGEMMIGQPLDVVFNNGQDPTGCQAGGGNLCAISGKKTVQTAFHTPATLGPPLPGQIIAASVPGGRNPISWGPHPNPPPLIFPPLCLSPYIGGKEPSSIENAAIFVTNLLVPGDPLGNPNMGIPPSGLLTRFQNSFFVGPGTPGQPLQSCLDYMYRQQVGQFLYVADRARREIVVLNSNRFAVLDRIPVTDPTDLAMGPNLDFLAVTNQNADTVSFININPTSSNFHLVSKHTKVGRSPRGIAWDPGNEDILVCNEGENTVSIISAFSLEVRKVVSSFLNKPFDLVISQRQVNFGFFRNVYFAYILNRNGDVAILESGPNGVNGWGFDDIIGVTPFEFQNPKKIALSPTDLRGSVWILHENMLNPDGTQSGIPGGAVTNIRIDSGLFGTLPLNVSALTQPQFRDMSFKVSVSVGPNVLTGTPTDLAFDNLTNLGAMANQISAFGVGFPIPLNGKSYVRPSGAALPTNSPTFMFLAVPISSQGPGAVDVLSVDSGFTRHDTNAYEDGVQSIPVPGAVGVFDYFRQ